MDHRPLTALARVLVGLVLLAALVGLGLAAALAASDLNESGEMFDGLGLLLAAVLAVPSLAMGVACGLALWLAGRQPRAARWLLVTLGALLLVGPLALMMSVGTASVTVLPALCGAVLLVAALLPGRRDSTATPVGWGHG